MFLRILKKDIKRKKTMNIILHYPSPTTSKRRFPL